MVRLIPRLGHLAGKGSMAGVGELVNQRWTANGIAVQFPTRAES
jgi:hypothetical protein